MYEKIQNQSIVSETDKTSNQKIASTTTSKQTDNTTNLSQENVQMPNGIIEKNINESILKHIENLHNINNTLQKMLSSNIRSGIATHYDPLNPTNTLNLDHNLENQNVPWLGFVNYSNSKFNSNSNIGLFKKDIPSSMLVRPNLINNFNIMNLSMFNDIPFNKFN